MTGVEGITFGLATALAVGTIAFRAFVSRPAAVALLTATAAVGFFLAPLHWGRWLPWRPRGSGGACRCYDRSGRPARIRRPGSCVAPARPAGRSVGAAGSGLAGMPVPAIGEGWRDDGIRVAVLAPGGGATVEAWMSDDYEQARTMIEEARRDDAQGRATRASIERQVAAGVEAAEHVHIEEGDTMWSFANRVLDAVQDEENESREPEDGRGRG